MALEVFAWKGRNRSNKPIHKYDREKVWKKLEAVWKLVRKIPNSEEVRGFQRLDLAQRRIWYDILDKYDDFKISSWAPRSKDFPWQQEIIEEQSSRRAWIVIIWHSREKAHDSGDDNWLER